MLESPALLASHRFPLVEDQWLSSLVNRYRDWLYALDAAPDLLRETLGTTPRSYKLGIYAETLLGFALRNFSEFQVLGSHRSVYEDRRATGEFDFVLRMEGLPIAQHWELAVKYFLLRERDLERVPSAKPHDFVGPNGRDSLGNKIHKMQDKQLLLGQTAAGREALEALGLAEVEPRILSRGCLFYDWNWYRTKIDLPDFVSDAAIRGWWCPSNELGDWVSSRPSGLQYAWLRRPNWLAPFDTGALGMRPEWGMVFDSSDELLTAMSDKFALDPGAAMIAELADGIEVDRGFVVHAGWPAPIDAHGA